MNGSVAIASRPTRIQMAPHSLLKTTGKKAENQNSLLSQPWIGTARLTRQAGKASAFGNEALGTAHVVQDADDAMMEISGKEQDVEISSNLPALKSKIPTPVVCHLTKNDRNTIQTQLGNLREETSTALICLQCPRTEIEVLTCPQLRPAKKGTQFLSMSDAAKQMGTWRNLRDVALETRPRRFLAYCSWSDHRY